jgi:alkylhydroperoxidase family enzyme
MAFIRTITTGEARGELRQTYLQIRRDMVGRAPLPTGSVVWNIMRVFSLRPPFLKAFARAFLHFMWDGQLRRQAKEAIGVTVAQTNRCDY